MSTQRTQKPGQFLDVSRGHDGGGLTRRRVSVLGATGSVGLNTLELIGAGAGAHDVVAVTANHNAAKLAELAIGHQAEVAVVADESRYDELKSALAGSGIEAAAGEAALREAAARPADWIMAAIIGAAGLRPTLAAVAQGTSVALANKECLVSAGELFMAEIARCDTVLLPVDSEHSAAFQAIDDSPRDSIERIVLTASGGPFRTWSADRLAVATPEQALCHPNWDMGAKITIDSATMMNKGFELIEAHHMFGFRPDKLGVVVHPQSIVHCLVEYCDGSVLAQMASPDMRTPIAYSLAWPARMVTDVERLDLTRIARLDFEPPDEHRFPALALARAALERGSGACAVLNAANEVAVAAFLARRIGFARIAEIAIETIDEAEKCGLAGHVGSLDDVFACDSAARRIAEGLTSARAGERRATS